MHHQANATAALPKRLQVYQQLRAGAGAFAGQD